MEKRKLLTAVIPINNEAEGLRAFWQELSVALNSLDLEVEVIFVDDGSTDGSPEVLAELAGTDSRIRVLELSRNFGKEPATTAGLQHSRGDAVLMIDGDGQHPPRLIAEFVRRWQEGAEVVIGVRTANPDERGMRKWAGRIFYRMMAAMSDIPVRHGATDFRLLDRAVVREFSRFTEHNRMTRSLIDWLGFRRDYIEFEAPARKTGQTKYGTWRLIRLALSGFVSHSLFPLKLAGYLGVIIVLVSGPLGLFIFLSKYVLNDPWDMNFSGPAILAVIILFLVGIVLSCLGLIALYIANIHAEVANRPLYAVRRRHNLEDRRS